MSDGAWTSTLQTPTAIETLNLKDKILIEVCARDDNQQVDGTALLKIVNIRACLTSGA